MKMSAERMQRIQQQVKENPTDTFALFALAKEFEKMSHTEKARDIYQKLLSIDPNYIGAYYHLGKVLEALDADNDALEIYTVGIEKSMKLNDRHAQAELQNAYQNLLIDLDE